MSIFPFWMLDSSHYDTINHEHGNTFDHTRYVNVTVRNEKEEFQKAHCKNCYDGMITERQFDEHKALDMLGEEAFNIPACVSMQAHLRSALFKFPNENFHKEITYQCPYSGSCEGDKNVSRTRKSITEI